MDQKKYKERNKPSYKSLNDCYTDDRFNSITNCLVNSTTKTAFLKVVNISIIFKSSEKFRLLDSMIENGRVEQIT